MQRRTVSSCAGRSLAVPGEWVPRATCHRHGDEWLSSTVRAAVRRGPSAFTSLHADPEHTCPPGGQTACTVSGSAWGPWRGLGNTRFVCGRHSRCEGVYPCLHSYNPVAPGHVLECCPVETSPSAGTRHQMLITCDEGEATSLVLWRNESTPKEVSLHFQVWIATVNTFYMQHLVCMCIRCCNEKNHCNTSLCCAGCEAGQCYT